MALELFIFDLDGTLIDSKLDLALAVNAVRVRAGMTPLAHEIVYSHVGNGAPVLIRRCLGLETPSDLIEEGVQFFYTYYREHMLDNTDLYPGVRYTLDKLLEQGKPMAVLTNKPVRFSEGIIAGLGLTDHFKRVYGGNSFASKKPDPKGINLLMEELSVPRLQTLMVGDSAVDVETARNAQVRCCGVTYGLQPESFKRQPPDFLIDRMEDLLAVANNSHCAA